MQHKKSIFLFSVLFCFQFNGFGQKKMSVLLFAIPQRTYLTNKWDKAIAPLAEKVPSYSVALGAMMQQGLSNRLSFNFGILFSYQAQKSRIYYAPNLSSQFGKTILGYFKIPLLVQYNFVNKRNYSFYLQAGPQLSLLLIEEGAIFNFVDILEAGGGYKPIVLDGVASLGVEFKIYKKIYYNFQVRIDHSLHNVNHLDYKIPNTSGQNGIYDLLGNPRSAEYNMSIGLLNGVSIKIK